MTCPCVPKRVAKQSRGADDLRDTAASEVSGCTALIISRYFRECDTVSRCIRKVRPSFGHSMQMHAQLLAGASTELAPISLQWKGD